MDLSGQIHTMAVLILKGKASSTYWITGWTGCIVGWDVLDKITLQLPGIEGDALATPAVA